MTRRVSQGEVIRCLYHMPPFGLFSEYECPCAQIVLRPVKYTVWDAEVPLFAAMTVPCELWDVDGVCIMIL